MKTHKVISLALVFAMFLSVMQIPAFANEEAMVSTLQEIQTNENISTPKEAEASGETKTERTLSVDSLLTYEELLNNGFNETSDQLTTSLNLNTRYGDVLVNWSSSNSEYITADGRVNRPRWDMEDQPVTLTATYLEDGETKTKSFDFIVLADEELKDPVSYTDSDGVYRDYMSDEEFFGKWDGTKWTTEGKFDYTQAELSKIEEAAKSGNYPLAKEELLNHMKTRDVEAPEISAPKSTLYEETEAFCDGVYTLTQNWLVCSIVTASSGDYATVYARLPHGYITKGGKNTFGIMARYNETSEAYIASLQNADPSLAPKVELTFSNKGTRIYTAEEDTTTRAGAYSKAVYGEEPDLKVKTFGEFLGDETYRAMMQFNFSDLETDDAITGARLIFNVKLSNSSAGTKDLVITREPTDEWKEESATYDKFLGFTYNFHGVPGENHWDNIPGADAEYKGQSTRFGNEEKMIQSYLYYGDERYAYSVIKRIMDIIHDKGYIKNYTSNSWYDADVRLGVYGSLDTAYRAIHWTMMLKPLLNSKYMSSDVITAMMKQFWDTAHNLAFKTKTPVTDAWNVTLNMSILRIYITFPEFANMRPVLDEAQQKFQAYMLESGVLEDGSTNQQANDYILSDVNNRWGVYPTLMERLGEAANQEIIDRIHKATLFSTQLRFPNGEGIQWGDSYGTKYTGSMHPVNVGIYKDPILEYVDSRGKSGTKPDWTSQYFALGRAAIMRSDWSENAMYMFTSAKGGGQHTHQDDNQVLVYAFDKVFLTDSGMFTYTTTDPLRIYGTGTSAHNTVEINGTNQKKPGSPVEPGAMHGWITNNAFDFLSQSTNAYESAGFDHRRTITFIKPNFWIVSDLMTPDDLEKVNSYKQLWHMRPDANLSADNKKNTLSSNYLKGANMTIGSADEDVKVQMADGYYDYNYQNVTASKYAYFEKKAAGAVTFDTVLLPAQSGNPEITTSKIELGVPTSEATAMKFESTVQGEKNTTYYLLDYEDNASKYRMFDKYNTNARLSVVREDKFGNIVEALLTNGKEIKTKSGEPIITSDENLADFSFEIVAERMDIYTSETEKIENIKVYTNKNITSVALNGQTVAFVKNGKEVSLTDEETYVPPVNDSSSSGGGVAPYPGSSSGGGSGSGAGGDKDSGSEKEENKGESEAVNASFPDVSNHWSAVYANKLKEKGILKGDDKGKFNPDNNVTRAEFITMIIRSLDLNQTDYKASFGDVAENDWYAKTVQTALDNDLISVDTIFRPNAFITRQEMSKIISVAAKKTLEADAIEKEALTFVDAEDIDDWAKEYVTFSLSAGLITGMEDGSFKPRDNMTRGQAAAVISRLLELK